MLQEAGHIKNTVVLILRYIQCLHLMNSEVAWVLVSSGSQVHPQIILDPDYLPEYLFVSNACDFTYSVQCCSINSATLNGVRVMRIIMKKKTCKVK